MCGRFYVESEYMAYERDALAAAALAQLFKSDGAVKTGDVFPGDAAAVVARSRSNEPSAFAMKWGYERPNAKGLIINARSESAASRPMFRESAAARRCAVPATRYYEWRATAEGKQKYSFGARGERCVYLGGLYRLEGQPRFVVLTREASEGVAFIHGRMPVVLLARDLERWLDPANDYNDLLALAQTDIEYEAV